MFKHQPALLSEIPFLARTFHAPFFHGNGLYAGAMPASDVASLSTALIYLLPSGFHQSPVILTEGIKMSNIRNWVEGRG